MVPGIIASRKFGETVSEGNAVIVSNTLGKFVNAISVSETIPAETQENDLLIAFLLHRSAATPPSGWNLEHTATVDDPANAITQYLSVFTKTAQAGDAGASVAWSTLISGRAALAIATTRNAAILSLTESITTNAANIDIADISSNANNQIALTGVSSMYRYNTFMEPFVVSEGWTQITSQNGPSTSHPSRMGLAKRNLVHPETVDGYFIRTAAPTDLDFGNSITLLLG